jgi:hypothetical protein
MGALAALRAPHRGSINLASSRLFGSDRAWNRPNPEQEDADDHRDEHDQDSRVRKAAVGPGFQALALNKAKE